MYPLMYTHAHTCTHTYSHTCTHKYTHMHTHTHTCIHVHTHAHTHIAYIILFTLMTHLFHHHPSPWFLNKCFSLFCDLLFALIVQNYFLSTLTYIETVIHITVWDRMSSLFSPSLCHVAKIIVTPSNSWNFMIILSFTDLQIYSVFIPHFNYLLMNIISLLLWIMYLTWMCSTSVTEHTVLSVYAQILYSGGIS